MRIGDAVQNEQQGAPSIASQQFIQIARQRNGAAIATTP